MSALHIITREGRDAAVTVETGRHGGPALVIRDTATGVTILGVKVEHASDAVLGTYLDPGTVETVRESFGLDSRY